MKIEKNIIDRINALIKSGKRLSSAERNNSAYTYQETQDSAGWMTSAIHVVQVAYPNSTNAYRVKCLEINAAASMARSRPSINRVRGISDCVGEMISVLNSLLEDIEAGLISSIENRMKAEIFDDFLDHAVLYLSNDQKNEAGVIAGVVFEDTIKRIGRINQLTVGKLESLINGLVNAGVLSKVKGKRAKAAADVRTQATHADWDAFEKSDVQATINFTKELISEHLDN